MHKYITRKTNTIGESQTMDVRELVRMYCKNWLNTDAYWVVMVVYKYVMIKMSNWV